MARFSLSPPPSPKSRRNTKNENSTPNKPYITTPPATTTSPSSPNPKPHSPWKWTWPPKDDKYYMADKQQHEVETDESCHIEEEKEVVVEDVGEEEELIYQSESVEDSDSDSSDDEDSSSNELGYSDESGMDSYSDSEEEEPPHPLGFDIRYGRTRFGLSPRECNRAVHNRAHYTHYDHDGNYFGEGPENDTAWNAIIHIDSSRNSTLQSFPPMSNYLDYRRGGVSSRDLINGANSRSVRDSDNDQERRRKGDKEMEELLSGMDRIANLVRAADQVNSTNNTAALPYSSSTPLAPAPTHSNDRLLQLAKACQHHQTNILPKEMSQLQSQMKQSYEASCQGFLLLLQADQQRVQEASKRIQRRQEMKEEEIEKERLEQERIELQKQKEREEAEQKERERLEQEKQRAEEERIKEEARLEQLKQAEEEVVLEAKKKNAYIERAQSLIQNLEKVRSGEGGLKEFDKSKAVSRRRLQFKKIVNGKINTLSHDEAKVGEVGRAVVDAIVKAETDDAEGSSGGGEVALGMGKKYLLDLLASNTIVRVQADGFNGTRGDGFPLAGMLALVSTQCDELGPVIEAHLYTACPTAIPTMALAPPEGDENELMESLGMIKDKNGEFETFDKFLSRTEGLISIMADIMSSLPSNHTLLGGHKGALTWLERFMDLLPPPPTAPLPLLTAPVLVAFLTGAGHMLANKFPNEFKPIFETISNDITNRLDESPIGVPSATRLKKVVVDEGWGNLEKIMPPGCVEQLYDGKATAGSGAVSLPPSTGGKGASGTSGAFGSSQTSQPSPFGQSAFGGTSSSTFGGASSSTFGGGSDSMMDSGGGNNASGGESSGASASNPFSTSNWGSSSFGSSFGASSTASSFNSQNPAPAAPAPASGGGFGSAGGTSFGSSNSGFGSGTSSGASGFGAVSSGTGGGGFGAASSGTGGFGVAPAPSSETGGFGAAPASTTATGGFGAAPAPGPTAGGFGGGASGFGSSGGAGGFGSSGGGFGSSGFGSTGASGGFGNAPAPAGGGFGAFSSGAGGFGASSSGATTGFAPATGSGASNPFGKPASSNPSPFGSAAPSPSPFGNTAPSSGFGGGGNKSQGKDSRPPCKFFAKGNCRFGASCRFSHEQQGGDNHENAQWSTSNASSAFNPARGVSSGATNPSPFGAFGGTGSSPFGNPTPFGNAPSNPFGGPRR